jgi:phosphatidylglycerophosphatase A
MHRLAHLISTVAHVGSAPIAPGTWGSAVGLGLLALVRPVASPLHELVLIAVLLVAGIWSAGVTGREMGQEDPGPIVIDEVVGMLVTLWWVPVNLTGFILAFLIFRVFDIVKPFPAAQCERLPGGWGVMLDDVMAGIYGNLVMRGLLVMMPAWLA